MCAAPDVIQKNMTRLLKTAPKVWQRRSDGRQRVGPGGQLRFGVKSSARLSSRPTPTPTSLTLKSLEETEGFDWE